MSPRKAAPFKDQADKLFYFLQNDKQETFFI
jgi:hypothetical protein